LRLKGGGDTGSSSVRFRFEEAGRDIVQKLLPEAIAKRRTLRPELGKRDNKEHLGVLSACWAHEMMFMQ
jgi:hypothetical protein